MNAENAVNVDVLKKRFESFQSSKIPVNGLDDKQFEKNANKRNIKRTPAFRRDVNNSRKLMDHSTSVVVTKNVKQFSNINLNTIEFNGISQINSHCKTDRFNQNSRLDPFFKDDTNNIILNSKATIQCLKKKLENSSAIDCKSKIPKISVENTLKTSLPVGPPPKKPPRTFAHDKQFDSDLTKKYVMESHTNSKSDPKIMLQKLEKFVTENSHTHGCKEEKKAEQFSSSDKKSNLFNLARSLKFMKTQDIDDNPLNIYHTDEHNYLTTKSYNDNNTEHIYDEPILLKSNSRLNINSMDNCHAPMSNELVGDADKSNLHYMCTPIVKDYSSENNLKKSGSDLKVDNIDEFSSKTNKIMTISHEKKIQMLVNEAYGTFIKTREESDSESISNNEDNSSGSLSYLTDKNISERTLERKGYLRRVAKKVTRSCSNVVQDKNHLFEALLLIGLDLSTTKEKLPYIKYKYPEQAQIPKQIENLCFPDAHVWPFSADDCRAYSLTVTDENGQRYYGYCYRVQPEGAAYCLPLVYCIYSSIKANRFYFKLLKEIESRHGLSEFNIKKFIGLLYNQPFPKLGSSIYIPQESENCTELPANGGELIVFDTQQEQDDLLKLLQIIKPNIFMRLLATMLLERKLILLSKSISLLSSSVDGLAATLYPFHWQHTLVSVLPSQMISVADFIQAPTPYIIGLLKTENQSDIFSQLSENDQVFIFDLDTSKILRKVKDEYSVIPSRIAKGLKSVIGLKVEMDQSTKAVLASESLIRLFIELIGHYRDFITTNSGDQSFQKQLFINAGINTAHRNFLEWFTETAMFTTFINDKLHSHNDHKDIFEKRCDEFSLELSKIKHKSKTLQSVKALGDRLKDWAVS